MHAIHVVSYTLRHIMTGLYYIWLHITQVWFVCEYQQNCVIPLLHTGHI